MKTRSHNMLQRFHQLNRLGKFVVITFGLFAFYTFSGFFIIPPIAKLVIEKKLPPLINRDVSVAKIRLNPLSLSASIEGFAIIQKESPEQFLSFDRLEINLQAISIFKRALVVKSAVITGPKINLSRVAGSRYNFSDLIPKSNESSVKATSSEPLLFSINNIEIKSGDIKIFDMPKEKRHHIADLNLAVASISNLPYDIEHFIKPSFSAVVNGTPLKIEIDAKPFIKSLETYVDIDIKDLNIVNYLRYLPNPTRSKLTSGLLDIKGKLTFSRGKGVGAKTKLSYNGKIILRDIAIASEAGEEFTRFPEITVKMATSNLLNKEVHVTDLLLTAPDFKVRRTKNLQILPLAFLLPVNRAKQTASKPAENDPVVEESTANFRLDIDNILIKEGHITFNDLSVQDFTTQITPVNVQLENFSTVKEKQGRFKWSLTTEKRESITGSGDFQLSPLWADGHIALTDISLAKYMPYVRPYISPELTSGLLSVSTDFSIGRAKDTTDSNGLLLKDIALSLEKIIARQNGKAIFTLPEFNLSGGRVNLAEKRVDIGNIISKQLSLTVIQDSQKRLNLSSFVKKTKDSEIAASDKKPNTETELNSSKGGAKWQLSVNKADISDYEIIFTDQSLETPVTTRLHSLNLNAAKFSTADNSLSSVDLSGYLNESGRIAVQGEIGVSPLSLRLEMDLKKLAFKPFQSYVDEYLYLVINSGSFSGTGTFSLDMADETALYHFQGDSSIDNFAVIDTRLNEDVMSWKKISLNDISFDSHPLHLTLGGLDLTAPFVNIIVSDLGQLNLTDLVKKSATESEKQENSTVQPSEDSLQKTVNIVEVSITGGSLKFVDNKINPAYSASLTEFNGKIAGLSSDPDIRADVDFKGKLNQFSPLKISGVINPLAKQFFTDLKIDLHDIDLSPTSPYTGKYLGYKTDKGKLTLNLHYLVDGKEIEAQNHLFLDQFTLGDTVDSPDAADLPLHLAIALLQNRAGEINLDIPVQGNLDDPEFSVAGVVGTVIFNLITKAVTSPFALLGALIPDGEDLQYIPFAAGKADIPQEHLKKLSKIASVLYERPGLRMDIIGKVAPEEDKKALQMSHLNRSLKLQKIKEGRKGSGKEELGKLADITISKEEYPYYLELAYNIRNNQKKTHPKQDKDSAVEKTSLQEMEDQLLAEIDIPNEELRTLAHTRAANVKNYLLISGNVEAERLFLVEPEISATQEGAEETKADNMPKQVELVIK